MAISIEPSEPSVEVGSSLELTATATDSSGAVVRDAAFTWGSSDDAILTVDGQGVVTGISAGVATVTASTADIQASVDVDVRGIVFEAEGDTVLSGQVTVESMTVPAGVTVSVEEKLTLRATGDVEIGGRIEGACTPATIAAGGALTVTGEVANGCPEGAGAAADLTLVGEGGFAIEDAEIVGGGDIVVTTDPSVDPGTAGGSSGPGAPPRVEGDPTPCDVRGSVFDNSSVRASAGSNSSTFAGDGEEGKRVQIMCNSGPLTVSGVVARGGIGGSGGVALGSEGVVTGGNGGVGGGVSLTGRGSTTVSPDHGPTILRAGDGGDGGGAGAGGIEPGAPAQALGGSGGRSGSISLSVIDGETIVIEPADDDTPTLRLVAGNGGDGGDAVAEGAAGKDATSEEAAGPGGFVVSIGGSGGNTHYSTIFFNFSTDGGFDDGRQIRPEGLENVSVQGGRGGEGGDATGIGGRGGAGSEEFPDGGSGGSITAQGGDGGSYDVEEPVGGVAALAPALAAAVDGSPRSGDGGDGIFMRATGGTPWSDCVVGEIKGAGKGGEGGDAKGGAGESGSILDGSAPRGSFGKIVFSDVGNGADGGKGDPAGEGGDGGLAAIDTDGVKVERKGTNFRSGEDGSSCRAAHETAVSVRSDPGGHEEFAKMTRIAEVIFQLFPGSGVGLFGESPWVPLSGSVSTDEAPGGVGNPSPGSASDSPPGFSARGVGTVAGISGITVTVAGTIETDETGRVSGFQGVLTIGADGGLPGGESATYDIVGALETDGEGSSPSR